MLPLSNALTFAIVAMVFVAIPGPSVLFVIGRAMARGKRVALLSVAGNSVGVYMHVIAVAVGIGAIVQRSVLAFNAIKLVGAAYLIYLGIQAIRHRDEHADVASDQGPAPHALREGFFVGLSNPKSIVFFAAILPQFADRASGHLPLQFLLLGLIAVSCGLVFDSLWALGAGRVRHWFAADPRRLGRLGGAGGAMMIGLGTKVALTGRHD
ncbi:LysE family translocator [soil metagenome]